MKTVITSTGNEINSKFDLRFGRTSYFCVYDDETGNTEFILNDNKEAQGGAGTKGAEKVIELGVTKVVSGHFGPKAKELLDKFKIQLVTMPDDSKTIAEIIEMMKK